MTIFSVHVGELFACILLNTETRRLLFRCQGTFASRGREVPFLLWLRRCCYTCIALLPLVVVARLNLFIAAAAIGKPLPRASGVCW